MNAHITSDGNLQVLPENEVEEFVIKKWSSITHIICINQTYSERHCKAVTFCFYDKDKYQLKEEDMR